jgi:hypothetical protein
MSLVRIWQLVLTACLMSALTASVAAAADSDVYFDVSVRGTGSATIHAKVYNNPANRGATTVLAVHGLTGTATTWQPLSAAMFADSTLGRAVKRVVAIDFVGHGLSSVPTLPAGVKFGDLLIEDNVSVLIQAIDKIEDTEPWRTGHSGPQHGRPRDSSCAGNSAREQLEPREERHPWRDPAFRSPESRFGLDPAATFGPDAVSRREQSDAGRVSGLAARGCTTSRDVANADGRFGAERTERADDRHE